MLIDNRTTDNDVDNAIKSGDVLDFSSTKLDDILRVMREVVKFSAPDENMTYTAKFNFKKTSNADMIEVFRYLMSEDTISKIRNSTIILNIVLLMKSYNTFDDGFFDHPLIFISSIDKFLDIKLALQDDLKRLNDRVADYFISIVRSLNKTEYTMLDSYVDLPFFYKSIFLTTDMITISGIMSSVSDDHQYKCEFIKDANRYMTSIARTYIMSDSLLNDFLGK